MATVIRQATMLVDAYGLLDNLHLLNHPGLGPRSFDPATAVRTTVQVVLPDITEILDRKGLSFVFRVPLLATDLTPLFLAFALGFGVTVHAILPVVSHAR